MHAKDIRKKLLRYITNILEIEKVYSSFSENYTNGSVIIFQTLPKNYFHQGLKCNKKLKNSHKKFYYLLQFLQIFFCKIFCKVLKCSLKFSYKFSNKLCTEIGKKNIKTIWKS